jgi:hypothetical protein
MVASRSESLFSATEGKKGGSPEALLEGACFRSSIGGPEIDSMKDASAEEKADIISCCSGVGTVIISESIHSSLVVDELVGFKLEVELVELVELVTVGVESPSPAPSGDA